MVIVIQISELDAGMNDWMSVAVIASLAYQSGAMAEQQAMMFCNSDVDLLHM